MNSAEHYRIAERLLREAHPDDVHYGEVLLKAQVHAELASAAQTAEWELAGWARDEGVLTEQWRANLTHECTLHFRTPLYADQRATCADCGQHFRADLDDDGDKVWRRLDLTDGAA